MSLSKGQIKDWIKRKPSLHVDDVILFVTKFYKPLKNRPDIQFSELT